MVLMMPIIREIVLKDEQQDDAHRDSERKAGNVENGKELVLQENPGEEFEMCAQHKSVIDGKGSISIIQARSPFGYDWRRFYVWRRFCKLLVIM